MSAITAMPESHPSKALQLDNQLCFALYSTMHAVTKIYAQLLADLGLTYPQYLVMLVLWEKDDVSVKTIGERLHLDSGTLTPLLKRLETAELLKRHRNPKDERQVCVRLTRIGDEMRTRACAVPVDMACAMGRPPGTLTSLKDDLLELRTNLIANLSDWRVTGADARCD